MPFAQSEVPIVPSVKTWKRETAWFLLVALLGFHAWGVFEPQAKDAAENLTVPIFLFIGGAFGLDAMAKQLR